MSQEEVCAWLEAHPGWHSTHEIGRSLGHHRPTGNKIGGSLRRAHKANQIKRRKSGIKNGWEWSA